MDIQIAIRALLVQWSAEEDPVEQARLLNRAGRLAGQVLAYVAPANWDWAFFPLQPDGVTVSVRHAGDCMDALAQLGAVGGGGHWMGRALHVAHILKSRQAQDGSWPACVDARTGASVGMERCAAGPLLLFGRLGQLLDSVEFMESARLAREWILRQEPDEELPMIL